MAQDIEFLNDDDDDCYTSLQVDAIVLPLNTVVELPVVASQSKCWINCPSALSTISWYGGDEMVDGDFTHAIPMSSMAGFQVILQLTDMRGGFFMQSSTGTLTLQRINFFCGSN